MENTKLTPPAGFATWIDWMIDVFGTPDSTKPPLPIDAIRAAARRELEVLAERGKRADRDGSATSIDAAPDDEGWEVIPIPSGLPGDPMERLTAAQLGEALGGLDVNVVVQLERERKVFSVPEADWRVRVYPAFQAWPGVAGEPLATVLAALEAAEEDDIYFFFAGQQPDLGTMTPVEVLYGRVRFPVRKSLRQDDAEILALPAEARLRGVCGAAKVYLVERRA